MRHILDCQWGMLLCNSQIISTKRQKMNNRKVVLDIISSVTPYTLSIICRNQSIEKRTINRHRTRICLCTECSKIRLITMIDNQIIRRDICLNKNKCQRVIVPLDFIIFPPQEIVNNFTLLDSTYSMPVTSAILSFA